MAPIKTFGERIVDALVEDGLISPKQVEELLEQQKKEQAKTVRSSRPEAGGKPSEAKSKEEQE